MKVIGEYQPQQHGPSFLMPHSSQPQSQLQQEIDLDDSGIGMSLMDDDLTMSKYGITGPHVGAEGMGLSGVRVDAL